MRLFRAILNMYEEPISANKAHLMWIIFNLKMVGSLFMTTFEVKLEMGSTIGLLLVLVFGA